MNNIELEVESADVEEQTPTFTIVNINDIMIQDNDAVVVRKRKGLQETTGSNKKKQSATDSSEEDGKRDTASDSESPSRTHQQNNRRKTQHTKILSDDKLAKGAAKLIGNATTSGQRVISNRRRQ